MINVKVVHLSVCAISYYLVFFFLWRTVDVSVLLSCAYQEGADLSAECHGGVNGCTRLAGRKNVLSDIHF